MKERLETVIVFPRLAGKRIEPPVNVLPMAACVDRQGISSVRVIDGESLNLNPVSLVDEALKNRPEIVGISVYTPAYPRAKEILRLIKERRPEVLTILGGKHPTHFYSEVLEDENADIVVVGEGEEVLPQIVAVVASDRTAIRQSLQGKPGIAFKGDSDVSLASKVDLRKLPALDFQFLYPDLNFYLKNKNLIVDMESSRGCFGHCTFCLASRYRKGISFKEPDRFVEEVEHLTEKGVQHFFLTDDDFMASFSHVSEVVKQLAGAKIASELEVNVRADSFLKCVKKDPSLLTNCRSVGIKTFHMGVESANPEILEYTRKNIDLDSIQKAVEIGTRSGLTMITNFIVGLPYDTRQSILDSINFAEELKNHGPHLCHISIFMPYPGTEAYDDAVHEGLLDPRLLSLEDLKDVHDKVVIPTKFLTISEIRDLYNKFYDTFYTPEYLEKLRQSNSLDYKTAVYLAKKRCTE